MADLPSSEPHVSPAWGGRWLPGAVVASLVFLIAAVGFLWWVLGSSPPGRSDGPARADAAQPDTLPAPATTIDDQQASTTVLRQAGPLIPAAVSVSDTREITPRLACGGGSIAYLGDQLVDGTDLGWGASSTDGAGQYADFSFGTPVHLSTVGITPGYLREARRPSNGCEPISSFGLNRFIDAVEWSFDDGTSVVQRFDQRPEMQLIPVDVTTSAVRMTILETTRPSGADDDTVVSEASFAGSETP